MSICEINTKDFEDFIKALKTTPPKKYIDASALEIANKWKRRAQLRSPVVTGLLRKSWHVTKETGDRQTSVCKVFNAAVSDDGAPYPVYVEYGHRQTPGRYVAKLGKRLKAKWVPGQFMLSESKIDVERIKEQVIAKHMRRYFDDLKKG